MAFLPKPHLHFLAAPALSGLSQAFPALYLSSHANSFGHSSSLARPPSPYALAQVLDHIVMSCFQDNRVSVEVLGFILALVTISSFESYQIRPNPSHHLSSSLCSVTHWAEDAGECGR